MMVQDNYENINGAVYIPTRAYNAYQQWRDFTDEVAKRDLGYAQKLNINAVRVWLSYEFWREHPEMLANKFESFLSIAAMYGIRVMPSLFECCGREPTRENMEDTDQMKAEAVRSPGTEITEDPSRWNEPFAFLDWFMEKYKDDSRLLAIEMTNEPKNVSDHRLCVALVKRAKAAGGSVPITVGAQELLDNLLYVNDIDILQFHENFVLSEYKLNVSIDRVKMVEAILGKPFWITEWQRIRSGNSTGFSGGVVAKDQLRPDHALLGDLLRKRQVGRFLWSLMLKPAYLEPSRRHGTFSGIFHEDGSVYSLTDARSVAGDPTLKLQERHELPEMFYQVAKLSE